MTDPQDDVPCRDCKRPTQHATEICDDCRTPAGRLVTALRERGIKSETSDDTDGVIVNGLFVDAVDCGWGISGSGDDLDGNIEAAASAIAAIVQAPGLRAAHNQAMDFLRPFTGDATTLLAMAAEVADEAERMKSSRDTLAAELLRQVETLTADCNAYRAELARLKAHTEATSPAGVGVEFGGPA